MYPRWNALIGMPPALCSVHGLVEHFPSLLCVISLPFSINRSWGVLVATRSSFKIKEFYFATRVCFAIACGFVTTPLITIDDPLGTHLDFIFGVVLARSSPINFSKGSNRVNNMEFLNSTSFLACHYLWRAQRVLLMKGPPFSHFKIVFQFELRIF